VAAGAAFIFQWAAGLSSTHQEQCVYVKYRESWKKVSSELVESSKEANTASLSRLGSAPWSNLFTSKQHKRDLLSIRTPFYEVLLNFRV
jgi:hypothetical protein